ncbi:putative phosphoprotein phosphatase [Candidatus Protochlamydia naegleriophila]|uniref:Putative phosphoprotein phosphatase n=1 Tax=Candidatus Protochlamydia naegleriophila TaxID=389348 RepID=A0A0U5CP76_9BACT|nr:PP2C family protein-serine/threonine phosphatase [Candidatus Protochlamydia naegleriophila]CUI16524.1 putative phosphoprotein phosphatase [Candidatus Protochlamydia naegleriophila]
MSDFTLASHERGYQLSFYEFCTFPFTAPYAGRHQELSLTCKESYRYGHKIIAFVEKLPLLGVFVSLIERIVALSIQVFSCLFKDSSVNPRSEVDFPAKLDVREMPAPIVQQREPIALIEGDEQVKASEDPLAEVVPVNLSEVRMLKNLKKAFNEHRKKDPAQVAAMPRLDLSGSVRRKLSFNVQDAVLKGRRSSMEDSHFHRQLSNGYVLGICDGHGDGGRIAEYISLRCQQLFSEKWAEHSNNRIEAFSTLLAQIHQEVLEKQIAESGGSTAVICFIEKQTNRCYVATLGDSEAKLFRKVGGDISIFPLSCVRDWSSEKDAKRASSALDKPGIADNWPKALNSKYLRFPDPFYGVNVSRSIGDQEFNTLNGHPAVIQKPKVTLFELEKNDLLVLACDGVWDYVQNKELVDQVIAPCWLSDETDIAQEIAHFALDAKCSEDNISVIALRVI